MREPQQDRRRLTQKLKFSHAVVFGSSDKAAKTEKERQENEDAEKAGQKKVVAAHATKSGRRPERDLQRFKCRYNAGVGNVMRNWMSLMYSILILRMNLIKFIFQQFPNVEGKNKHLAQQILLECKVIYQMIRKAQHFSQKRALALWSHLERLIINRSTLKNYLETTRRKDFSCKDWKGMAARLEAMQKEFAKLQVAFNAVKAERNEREKMLTSRVQSLEKMSRSKDEELEQLIDQIMHLKKVELEASCQIIGHLKTYRDLSTRKKELLIIDKELKQLKSEQDQMVRDFSSKVKALKIGIVEKDNEIKAEKEEKKKLKKSLKNFGNVDAKTVCSCGNEAVA